MNEPNKTPLLGMTLEQLRQVTDQLRMPSFAAKQIAQWLYDKRVGDIEQMTNLSKSARQQLSQQYCVGLEPPLTATRSIDGTVKYLFRGAGGCDVEAVYIPDHDRATLCVSSQAGCRMGCTFCMTGRQGYHGNLTTHQIINQIMSIDDSASLTNVVFMGMGEPMDNYDAVVNAIEILTAPWGLAWSPKRITVSTIGKLKELRRLIESTKVHIAVSLHSPNTAQRQQLMPIEQAYGIRDVVAMLRDYDFAHQRRLSFEYIMWRGVNDSLQNADALAKLIRGTSARVNLIRFHAIPDCDLRPTSQQVMEQFRDRLNQLGVTATIRASRGEDIMAACGMLAGKSRQTDKHQPSNQQQNN